MKWLWVQISLKPLKIIFQGVNKEIHNDLLSIFKLKSQRSKNLNDKLNYLILEFRIDILETFNNLKLHIFKHKILMILSVKIINV